MAKSLCEEGIVAVNGAAARASKEVAEGDEITVSRRDRTLVYRIRSVPPGKQVSKEQSRDLVDLISDTPADSLIP